MGGTAADDKISVLELTVVSNLCSLLFEEGSVHSVDHSNPEVDFGFYLYFLQQYA